MGNYAATNQRISDLNVFIEQQKQVLTTLPDGDEADAVFSSIADAQQALGECEGFLEEIAQEDGYNSYEDYCDDYSLWYETEED